MATAYNDFRVSLTSTNIKEATYARGKGAVACVSGPASKLAIQALQDGGNAFDAAFTLAFALCVYHPQAGNIGGGGYVVYQAKGGSPQTINYREQAPANAYREAFLLTDGSPDPEKTSFGPTSVCVPGTVKAFFTLQKRYGKLKAQDLLLKIAKLAEDGIAITQYEATCLNRLGPKLAHSPESKRFYVRSEPFKGGDILANQNLARTLIELAAEGEAAFYRGRIAENIVNDLANNGGFITADDLASYTLRESLPIVIEMRDKQIWTAPPEGGGAILLNILNILDCEDFYQCAPGSANHYHYLAQAAKVAFINRLDYLGDTKLQQNAVYHNIFSKINATRLFNLINQNHDIKTDALAQKIRQNQTASTLDSDMSGNNTTHFSIIDADGNAVSNSYTMNLRYGSKWSVAGCGFLLNGSMDSFSFIPGKENYFGVIGNQANLFASNKRPASNMAPVLVTKNNQVDLVIGTPGGPTIATTLASIITLILFHNIDPAEAIKQIRLHHQGWPDVLYKEPDSLASELSDSLMALGYNLKDKGEPIGDVHGVFRIADEYLAVSDSRREGQCAAY
ncbi:MAG: gamma-glutamyltransferase [Deltaproteobacteria bacterium]|nr:gamma-glutamyltransferase [Deltaproteobacteria bacterium]